MEIILKGKAKDIAALALALQERRGNSSPISTVDDVANMLGYHLADSMSMKNNQTKKEG